MDSRIKRRMLIIPLVFAVVGAITGFLMIYFIEHQLINMFHAVSKVEVEVKANFPYFVYLILAFSFAIPGLKAFLFNLIAVRQWRSGLSPSCPVCGFPMIQRIARRGPYIGQCFWGCYQYPRCCGKIHIG